MTNKQGTYCLIGIGVILIAWYNRSYFFVNKKPLDAAAGNGNETIEKALNRIKTGAVIVNKTPEEVKDAFS